MISSSERIEFTENYHYMCIAHKTTEWIFKGESETNKMHKKK